MTTDILQVEGLGKDYGKLTAVAALDLSVPEGDIFALLGPNGAGKTTAISMIAGVVTPGRGTASVAGHDIRTEPFAARRQLGLVPQDLALYEEISAVENLRFFASLYGLRGATLRERIDWALELAGLADRAHEPVARYSGGMKRRLNLVAGLMHRPRLVILDEPTVGVDPQSRNHIFQAIRQLSREEGMTILYTSHYMEEVQSLCEHVAILDHGALIAQDTVDRLISAHGDGTVEVRFRGDPAAVEAATAELGRAEVDGDRVRAAIDVSISELIRAIESTGGEIVTLRSIEADLESVFLSLTGHTLRDED